MAMDYVTFQVDEYTVYLYEVDHKMTTSLREARHRGVPLCGPYSYRKDQPHSPMGQYHLHVYRKGNELFALNFDGTAHDQNHGVTIPNKVADALRQRFPDLILPANNLIESDNGSFDFLVTILA